MKRLFCFVLILLLLIPSALAEEPKATFRIEDAKGNVGDTVTVIGAVENFPTCASFRVILTYDASVLKPEKVTKLDCGGLFMSNVNFTHKTLPAVNVLSADAKKSFEGTKQLFSVTFRIIGESPETDGSPIQLAHKEFFDPSTPKPQPIDPTVILGKVYVGDDQPTENQPENNEGTDPDQSVSSPEQDPTTPPADENSTPSEEGSAGEGEGTPSTPENKTEENPADETEKEESKAPTGSWIVDSETEDIYHVDEEGNDTVFTPEYKEEPKPGVTTEVILKNPETGEEEGSIKVEIQEDGSLEVLEQDVPALRGETSTPGSTTGNQGAKKEGLSIWVWIGIGAGALALAGVAVWGYYAYRKMK